MFGTRLWLRVSALSPVRRTERNVERVLDIGGRIALDTAMGSTVDLPERRWSRQYRVRMAVACAAYVVISLPVFFLLPHVHGSWKYLLAVLPALPFVGGAKVVSEYLRQIDERMPDHLLRTFAFAFCWTAIITVAYGLLERAGAYRLDMYWVWVLMGTLWMVGGLVTHKD